MTTNETIGYIYLLINRSLCRMAQIPFNHLPLRVNQMDASAFDGFLYNIVLERIQAVFKLFRTSTFVTDYQVEVEAAVKGLFAMAVMRPSGATLGQQMLGLRYTNMRELSALNSTSEKFSLPSITNVQAVLYVTVNVLLPYIEAKLKDRLERRNATQHHGWVYKLYTFGNVVWSVLNLVNFMAFLLRGNYFHLYERLLGIHSVHPQGRTLRQVGYEFSNREILWHGFAEFMLFVSPFINMRRIRGWFSSADTASFSSGSQLCVICEQDATNPQQICSCPRLYCYHCICEQIMTSGMYTCSECTEKITSLDDLIPAAATPLLPSVTSSSDK